MQMPRPNENHKKLEALAGKWRGKETIHPTQWDPKGGEAIGESDAAMAFDGFCLIMDYTQTRNGAVSYRGHGVFGWDDKVQKYSMYWFDSMAGAPFWPAAEGTWSGNSLVYVSKSPMGWSRYSYHFDTANKFRFTIEMSQDGQTWSVFIDSAFERV